jgi:hypothetical protein
VPSSGHTSLIHSCRRLDHRGIAGAGGRDPKSDLFHHRRVIEDARGAELLRALVSDSTAVDIDRLTGDEGARIRGQKHRRAAEIIGRHVALDHAGIERMRPDLFHHRRVIEDAFAGGKPGDDGIHPDRRNEPSFPRPGWWQHSTGKSVAVEISTVATDR